MAAASSAEAKKKHKKPKTLGPVVTVSALGNTSGNPGLDSVATAVCPSGTEVTGGGFSAPYAPGAQLVVHDSYRSDARSWKVAAANVAGSGAVTAYAYCRRAVKPISDAVTTSTVPSGAGANVNGFASCPGGSFAINGGFQSTTGPGAGQFAHPVDSTGGVTDWSTFFRNMAAGTQTLTTHAYCMSGIKAPAIRQDQIQVSVPVFGSVSEFSACLTPPKGKAAAKGKKKKKKKPAKLLSAGGFLTSYPIAGPNLPIHVESHISGGRWLDRVVNGGTGAGITPAQSASTCF